MKAVERLPHPTRDVLVVRALDGDRTFAGFGKASTVLCRAASLVGCALWSVTCSQQAAEASSKVATW